MIRTRLNPLGGYTKLPVGYKACAYLESSGLQYIDTGLVSKPSIQVKIKLYQQNGNTLGYGYNWGVADSSTNAGTYAGTGIEAYWRAHSSSGSRIYNYFNKIGSDGIVIWELQAAAQTCMMNNQACTSSSSTSAADSVRTIWLFEGNFDGSFCTWRAATCRVYYAEFWYGNELVGNFTPALDPSGRPCLYDYKSKKPFYNQGSSEFGYCLKTQE